MQPLNIQQLVTHDVKIYLLKHGMIAIFPMINSLNPTLLSIDNGRTWSVVARNSKGLAAWKSEEIEMQGPKLDSAITKMYKDCKFGDPIEAIEVAHILMVNSLTGG